MGDLTIPQFVAKALQEDLDHRVLLFTQTHSMDHKMFSFDLRAYEYPGRGGRYVFVGMTYDADSKPLITHMNTGWFASRHFDSVMQLLTTEMTLRIGHLS